MAKPKQFNFAFNSDEIGSVSIHKSKNGYNYADISIKRGNDQFIRLGYEWSGEMLPDFAMDVVGYIQMEKASIENNEDLQKEIAAFKDRLVEACR
jgi:hypothetical protein